MCEGRSAIQVCGCAHGTPSGDVGISVMLCLHRVAVRLEPIRSRRQQQALAYLYRYCSSQSDHVPITWEDSHAGAESLMHGAGDRAAASSAVPQHQAPLLIPAFSSRARLQHGAISPSAPFNQQHSMFSGVARWSVTGRHVLMHGCKPHAPMLATSAEVSCSFSSSASSPDPLLHRRHPAGCSYRSSSSSASSASSSDHLLDLRHPASWYPLARQMKRTIIAHLGPTNSGVEEVVRKRWCGRKRFRWNGRGSRGYMCWLTACI